jgi:ABC-type hemin transport system substrate-binding protein
MSGSSWDAKRWRVGPPDVILVAQESAIGDRWDDTPAGRSGKVFDLDLSAGVSPGPRSATLLVKIAGLLHPDLIP